MANANDMRKGNAVWRDGDIYIVLDLERVKPGKGGAFVQTTLRNIRTGRTSQVRFSSTETVEIVPLIRKKLEFSYRDGGGYVFMDPETFDQITIPEVLVDSFKDYIIEGTEYDLVLTDQDIPLRIELPPSIVVKVVDAPEGLKGDSATNVRKTVRLETGLELNTPLFIKEGELIKVDTRTGEYLGRA
ncbi:MAG: elongation factor P [Candidatus Euphemobacter frigidus]|nr:elongation factor P [Candidatus Euphemobacter frigidus]MDP8275340.1 elongation factor P [Candidatus Euphemobacter frigidus]